MNNISFLFGCGISIPAGLPGTKEITSEILYEWNNWYKCDTQYRLKANSGQTELFFSNSPYSQYPRIIASFVNLIKNEIKQYYGFIAKTDSIDNYEEIYDLIYHINQALIRNIDNPLTNRMIICMLSSCEFFHPCAQDKIFELRLLCTEALQFIKNVVHIKLQKEVIELNSFSLIKNVIDKGNVKGLFTLNHDTLLETYLKNESINYYDGFSNNAKNGIRFWESGFANNSESLQYLKLHGSINWFNFRTDNGLELKIRTIGLVEKWQSDSDVDYEIDGIQYRVDKFPNFLTGTNDKYLEYNYGQYLELFSQFHSILKTTNTLIIAGYGFGDNAVNLRIIDWFESNQNAIIEIISPDITNTMANAKGAIYSRLKKRKETSRIKLINKGIEKTDTSDLFPVSK